MPNELVQQYSDLPHALLLSTLLIKMFFIHVKFEWRNYVSGQTCYEDKLAILLRGTSVFFSDEAHFHLSHINTRKHVRSPDVSPISFSLELLEIEIALDGIPTVWKTRRIILRLILPDY